MKSIISYVSLILFPFVIISCVSSTIEPTEREVVNFEVHFQNSFDDDDVLLRIDNNNIFVGNISTDNAVSVAKILKLQQLSGNHLFYLNVNNNYFETREYELNDTLYILVRYHENEIDYLNIRQGIDIEFTNLRPLYD